LARPLCLTNSRPHFSFWQRDRQFAAGAPNRCWVADITYLRTWEGWLYLVAVQDLFSPRIVNAPFAEERPAPGARRSEITP